MVDHTELPWKWHSRVEEDLQTGSVYAEPRRGHAYSVAVAPKYQETERWKADATLIVKAVNNHEALVKALEFYANPHRYDGPNRQAIEGDPYAKTDDVYLRDVTRDHGEIARAALALVKD